MRAIQEEVDHAREKRLLREKGRLYIFELQNNFRAGQLINCILMEMAGHQNSILPWFRSDQNVSAKVVTNGIDRLVRLKYLKDLNVSSSLLDFSSPMPILYLSKRKKKSTMPAKERPVLFIQPTEVKSSPIIYETVVSTITDTDLRDGYVLSILVLIQLTWKIRWINLTRWAINTKNIRHHTSDTKTILRSVILNITDQD